MALKALNNVVIVKKLEDFPTPVSGIIVPVANVSYQINGTVNIGTNQIERGVSNVFFGLDKSNDKLVYTGTSSMFIDGASGANQDMSIGFLTLAAITAGGSVFNLTGSTNKTEIRDCIFGSSASIGTLNGGGVLSWKSIFCSGNSGGLTVQGTWGYVALADTFWVSNSSTITCISIPSGSFTEIVISRNVFDVSSGQTALNISLDVTANIAVVELCDFNGAGTYITPLNYLSTVWNLRTNRGITNTFTFFPRAYERSAFTVRATNATRISSGITTSAFGASAAVANDNTTSYTGYTSTGLTGSFAGLESTSFQEIRPDYSPIFAAVIKTDSTITNVRYWIGFISATLTNADDQAGAYAAFRFSTVAGDTGWRAIVDNGTTQTVSSNIGTVAASTQYKFEIQIDYANTKTYFRVNGGAWTTISVIPPSGTNLGVCVELVVTSNSARVLNFSRFDGNHN